MNKYPEEIIKCIDNLFPKGDKRRGDALVLQAVAYLEGKTHNEGLICPTSKLPKGFKEGKCKCGNSYGYCGLDIGYCVKCIDKMEVIPKG